MANREKNVGLQVFFGILGAVGVIIICIVVAYFFIRTKRERNFAKYEKATQEYVSKMTVHYTWNAEGNYTYVRGQITNTGDKTTRYWKLIVQYSDHSGPVLDSAYTSSIERLGPGESKQFEVMQPNKTSYNVVNVFVEEVRLE